jgi:hypothetical protein
MAESIKASLDSEIGIGTYTLPFPSVAVCMSGKSFVLGGKLLDIINRRFGGAECHGSGSRNQIFWCGIHNGCGFLSR